MPPEPRKTRRTANACIACRQSKIKCSGEEPCANCKRRIIVCRFTDGGNKIVVSEKYLRQLRRQAAEGNGPQQHQNLQASSSFSASQPSPVSQSSTRKRSLESTFRPQLEPGSAPSEAIHDDVPSESNAPDDGLIVWANPFTLPSTTIKNTHKNRRNWIWLAPWSTWSFTVRLSVVMSERLQVGLPIDTPSYLGTDVYPLKWRRVPEDVPPDISGLPSIDRAYYLYNTVKFHIGHHYSFIDDASFVKNLHDFYYGNAQEKAIELRLWFVQYLIVLAFGNAFISASKKPNEPPGAAYFVRAMELLPELSSLWKDSLLGIEVLALTGLYLYSIDHRESASVHVGQAFRIAQLEGLHTRLPEEELGADTVIRCRNLWWTLYIMDRHFSTSLGIPMSTADSDITALTNPSSTGSQEDTILNLQVKLSHLMSVILRSIYNTDKTEMGQFLEITRNILHTLAGHAQEIESIIQAKFHNSVATMSKGTRHITLLYHQCVIIATRPLLLSILKQRLEKLSHGDEDWQGFFELTTTLIAAGIKSATKTLQILSDEENFLDVFLPFDLEFTYGAALHMVMAGTLFPGIYDDQSNYAKQEQAHAIFDEMINRGNLVAQGRKAELVHIESLFHELARQSEQRGLETLTLNMPEGSEVGSHHSQAHAQHATHGMVPPPIQIDGMLPIPPLGGELPASPSASTAEQSTNNLEFMDNIGISSYEFFSIVDQMGQPDLNGIMDPRLM